MHANTYAVPKRVLALAHTRKSSGKYRTVLQVDKLNWLGALVRVTFLATQEHELSAKIY